MANSTTFCTSAKEDFFWGRNNFAAAGGFTYNMALYTSTATLDATTTAYATTGEIAGTGYVAKGQGLTNIDPATSGTTAFIDFSDEAWTSSSFTANAALIFASTGTATQSVSTHAFGSDKTVTSGTFTVQFPVADASNAILRIA